jgi:ABC-type uncharacterized transport system involved in gliding motility auxiliary subunit
MGLTVKRSLAASILLAAGLVLLASAVVTLLLGDARLLAGKVGLGLAAVAAGAALAGREGLGRALSGRGTHYAAVTVVSGLLLAATLAAAGWVASRRPVVLDVTRQRIHTLSPDTLRTLDSLPGDVEVLAFFRPDDAGFAPAQALLARYAERNRRFRYEMVDPYRSPDRVRRHQISESGTRVVVAPGPAEARLREVSEESLTNALVRVSHPSPRRVYFTQGHGEGSPGDAGRAGWSLAARALERENVELAPLSLLSTGEVPADAAALLVVGPRKPFLDPEVEALRSYASRGGHLGVFVEPESDAGLDPLLGALGVEAGNDMIVDPNPLSRLAGATPVMPVLRATTAHPVSEPLAEVGVVFPTARSLVALRGAPARAVPLALTSESAWAENDVRAIFAGAARLDEGEKVGPVPLALAVRWPVAGDPPRELRAVVAGDSDFFSNGYLHLLGNQDLFLSMVSWLSERDDRLTIRPRAREASRIALTEAQVGTLKFLSIDVVPVALLLAGVAVWLSRRER